MHNLFNTSEDNYLTLELPQEGSFSELEFNVIWNNQVLELASTLLLNLLAFSNPEKSSYGPRPTSV